MIVFVSFDVFVHSKDFDDAVTWNDVDNWNQHNEDQNRFFNNTNQLGNFSVEWSANFENSLEATTPSIGLDFAAFDEWESTHQDGSSTAIEDNVNVFDPFADDSSIDTLI